MAAVPDSLSQSARVRSRGDDAQRFDVGVPAATQGQHASRPRSGPVTMTRVVPAVWRMAMRLAGGDARRLRLIDQGTVLVLNRREGR
jgi:hypothetical protein